MVDCLPNSLYIIFSEQRQSTNQPKILMKLKNDQIKLLADTVKGVGVAWIVGGIIAPLLRVEGPLSVYCYGGIWHRIWCPVC